MNKLYVGQDILVNYELLDSEIQAYFGSVSNYEGYATVSKVFGSIDGVYIDEMEFIIPFSAIVPTEEWFPKDFR